MIYELKLYRNYIEDTLHCEANSKKAKKEYELKKSLKDRGLVKEIDLKEFNKKLAKLEQSAINRKEQFGRAVANLQAQGKVLAEHKEALSIPVKDFVKLTCSRLDRKAYKMGHNWKQQIVYKEYKNDKDETRLMGYVCVGNVAKDAPDTLEVQDFKEFFAVEKNQTPNYILVQKFIDKTPQNVTKVSGSVCMAELSFKRLQASYLPTFNITSFDSNNVYAQYYEELFQEHLKKDIVSALEAAPTKTK